MRASSTRGRRSPVGASRREHSWRTRILRRDRFEFVNPTKVDVSGNQDLNAIPLALRDGRRDRNRALEHFGRDLRGAGGIHDCCAIAAAGGLNTRLKGSVDHRDKDGGSEALPEVPIDLPWKPCTP